MTSTYNNVKSAGNLVYTTNNTSGQFLTSTGSNGTSWTTNTTTTPYDAVLVANQNPASLEVKGKMIINGQDLEERLDTIETVLQIPPRDIKMEKKHPKLKKLYDEYIKELSKYRMWNKIKGEE